MTEEEFILPLEKRTDSGNQSNQWENQFQLRKRKRPKNGKNPLQPKKNSRLQSSLTTKKKT